MSISTSNEVMTVPAKYVFLDTVGFTHDRSVEAQSEIVGTLNHIVNETLKSTITQEEISKVIKLPTGDGICLALLNIENPYDVHMKIALEILRMVHSHNETATDEMRKFQVRLGVAANTDNLVIDVNGQQNIAGAGISMAQRVMSMADGGQILVAQTVSETLLQRERYMKRFERFNATIKHGETVPMYQFVGQGFEGLNTDSPSAFLEIENPPSRLTLSAAYYFAHAIKNRSFLLARKDDFYTFGCTLLWLLAQDSIAKATASETRTTHLRTYDAQNANFEKQYAYYKNLDFFLLAATVDLIKQTQLPSFVEGYYDNQSSDMRFISAVGMKKLATDWPEIWAEFELDGLT